MRRVAAIGIWVLAAAYGVSLASSVDATLSLRRLVGFGPGPNPILLAPLDPATRSAETRVPGLRIRRLCEAGRCELLVGRDGAGFELMASYPADRWVALDRRGDLQVRDIGRARPVLDAELPPRWILTGVLGALLAGILLGRGRRLREQLARLGEARAALVIDGRLSFLDGAAPRRAIPCEPLPDGPATALREAWPERRGEAPGGDGPYRDAGAARWVARAGARDARLVRAAERLGAHALLGRVLIAGTAFAVAVLVAGSGS